MKKILLAALVAATPFAAYASPENYTLDPTHTYPHFAVAHLGVSTMWGRFGKTTGRFMLDKVAKKASIGLVVETASIDTGDNVRGNRPRSRDEHLRAADFFNVQEFPTMTYKSTNVKFAGENPSEIEGQLTLLGVGQRLDQFGLGIGAGVQELQHALEETTRLRRMFGGPANWGPA